MFLKSIHGFRALAIVCIVCTHAIHNFSWPKDSLALRSLDSLFTQSSIWFVFIAGFLFQHLLPRYGTKDYYHKKLTNVIAPYAILSIPAIGISLMGYEQDVPASFYDLHPAAQAGLFLLTGKHMAALWFVPMIAIIYLLAPLLVRYEGRSWFYWSIPPLLLVSLVLGRDGLVTATGLSTYFTPLSRALYMLSPYLLGMWASRHHAWLLRFMGKHHLWFLLLPLTALLLNIHYHEQQIALMFIYKTSSSLLLVHYLGRAEALLGARMGYLAEVSFGIFFIHGYLLSAAKLGYRQVFDATELPPGSVLGFLAFTLSIVGLCVVVLWLGKRLLGRHSRIVLGC